MLESKGYKILATNYKITSKGESLAEIDIVAEKNGDKYAIEVKSGKANSSSIRQVYANAKLAGYKPLLICKKIDEANKEAARKLNVDIIEFSEYHLLLEPEELEAIVKNCMEEVMEEYGLAPYSWLEEDDFKFFKEIAKADKIEDVLNSLKISEKKFGEKLAMLSKKGIIPSRPLSFKDLKRYSMAIISRNELMLKIENIEKEIEKIKKMIKKLN